VFKKGLQLGECGYAVETLSYAFDNFTICVGKLPALKGSIGSPEGNHVWLISGSYIYDTSLLLKIHKSVAKDLGYESKINKSSNYLLCDESYKSKLDFICNNI
jgi:hypothetical protein